MKRILTQIVLLSVALLTVSCGKDYITPDELFRDDAKIAQTKITVKSDKGETTNETVPFDKVTVYKASEFSSQSWLSAWSGGRMSYNMFYLSIYFQDIEKMKLGETLKPNRASFMLPASSDSRDYTDEYSGKITLADKGDDYVILDFHKVGFSIGKGDYLIDGYLHCKLEDKFELTMPDIIPLE